MRAFVNHVEPVVAPILLDRKIARVAVAAQHLNRQRIGFQTPFAGPAFGDGRQHFEQQTRLVGRLRVSRVLLVHQPGAIQLQRQCAFAIGFLRQQHALDISVLDDAALRRGGVLASAGHGPALWPVFGVVEGRLITRHAQHGGRHADGNTRLIHHVEHAAQAFVRLAHEVTDSAGPAIDRVFAFAKIEQRVGCAAPAELVVQAGQRHVVANAGELTVGIDHFLGHDKERNTFGAGNEFAVGAGNLGQHQMDDVLGQLMLTG